MITKEIVAEPLGGVTIVAMGAIDADVIETVQLNVATDVEPRR